MRRALVRVRVLLSPSNFEKAHEPSGQARSGFKLKNLVAQSEQVQEAVQYDTPVMI
jgi:hypothetical protein